jgi:hypothetical protein
MYGLFIDKSDRFASIMKRIGFREGPYRGFIYFNIFINVLFYVKLFCFISF